MYHLHAYQQKLKRTFRENCNTYWRLAEIIGKQRKITNMFLSSSSYFNVSFHFSLHACPGRIRLESQAAVVTCLSDGNFVGSLTCEPVVCDASAIQFEGNSHLDCVTLLCSAMCFFLTLQNGIVRCILQGTYL